MTDGTVPLAPPLTRWRLLLRGLTRRCPVCGKTGIFRRWFWMVRRCPRCDFRFEREQGDFIGAIGVNTIVTFGLLLVVVLTSVLLTYPDGMWIALVAALAVAILFPLVFYPFSKTLWLAVNLAMRPLEPGEALPPWGQPD